MTRSPYRGVVWARSWSSFVSDSSRVGLLVQGKEYIAQRTFTKQRRAGLDKKRVECHMEGQVVSQILSSNRESWGKGRLCI